jgi:SgrR family transcriptional regulator
MKKKLDTRMRDITADSNPVSRQEKLNEVEEYLKKEGMLLFLTHKEIEVSYDTFLNGVEFNARKWIDFKKLWYKPPQIQDILSED